MTPKEKAEELVGKCYDTFINDKDEHYTGTAWRLSKQCALIAVEEILQSESRTPSNVDWDDVGGTHQYYYEAQREEAEKFWQQVKQEIEKL